jgi:two-component system LytT family response regulator
MYTAMLVEDEINILKHMNKMVSAMEDFVVKGAFDVPEEALDAFADILPDVVLLDIEMPRMNGLELARKMLDLKQDLHIVFLTAYNNYALNAFEVGAIDYLMKPVMKEDLERTVKRLNKLMGKKQEQVRRESEEGSFPARCFGCFEVRDRKQQLIKWPTKRAEEVFAYFLGQQEEYVSKWELLEVFWPEMEEDRGLHNLHNTLYRIKKVLKLLSLSPQIQKVNDGYILEAEGSLSDLRQYLIMAKQKKGEEALTVEEASEVFLSYAAPLFGTRDYFWSLPLQKNMAQSYKRICHRLLLHYREQDRFCKGEEIIRHYVVQHVEDEEMMKLWLRLVASWKGYEEKTEQYRNWFNEKLKDAELPLLG